MPRIERAPDQSVGTVLTTRATASPEAPCIVFGDAVVSYGQLDQRAEALAASLAELGVQPGERLALVLPAWPEFVVAVAAGAKLGLTIVPLNPLVTAQELQYLLRHSGATVAITVETYHGTDYLQVFENILERLPDLRHLATVGDEDLWYDDQIYQFEDLLSAGAGRAYRGPDIRPDEDVFALLYTAGTTGKSKAVELTHSALLDVAWATAERLGLEEGDRVIGLTGLFHVFGLGPGLLGSMLAGASVILQDHFDAADTLDLVERHRATVHMGVPTLLATSLAEQATAPRDLSSLRTGIAAGAPLADHLVDRVAQELCPGIQVAYTITEMAGPVTMTDPSDALVKRRQTVGRPMPGTEVRIVDPDGAPLPVESIGEIRVRGPGRMKRYLRQPVGTASAFDDDGYFRTGDLGLVDEDGYLHLVGRNREVIIRSGISVYPREVEERLLSHPAVGDAAVVGVPDDVLGEAIYAAIVPVEGAMVTDQELRDWCRIALADYRIPDEVRFLDAFPMTGTGKVRRLELARRLMSGRGSGRPSLEA